MINKIIFNNVNHAFGDNKIFENISLELNAGKIIVVTGANGSGKSTFLKLAGQFIQPDSGTVKAFEEGKAIDRIDFRYRIAAVAPNMNLYSELTAVENINFFVGLRDISLDDLNIDILFKRVELSLNCKNKVVSSFSTGMIQRLKFAILLAVGADVWLLDEPCSNLDEAGKSIILDEIKNAASTGKLILMATNDRDEVNIGDEIINLPIN